MKNKRFVQYTENLFTGFFCVGIFIFFAFFYNNHLHFEEQVQFFLLTGDYFLSKMSYPEGFLIALVFGWLYITIEKNKYRFIAGTLGDRVDTLVSSYMTGKSVSFPRASGDGKFLMFTMSDYGNFSIWHKEADLYLLNLTDGTVKPVSSANSDNTESYHSWSSGSRWFVFSSRRIDGLYTRPYIAWLNENGEASKPFLLPQKDPDFYDGCLQSFNIPEFVTGKVRANGRNMLKTIGSAAKNVTFELKD